MKAYLSFLFVLLTTATFAQTKDCYPNCSVTFDMVVRERVPSITSVEAIGTKCKDEVDKKLKEYRDADQADFTFLKNKYCAALSGWEQTGDCIHGGPPPCCTAPTATSPWASVGTVKAKAALMAEWHKVQNERQAIIEKNLFDCLHGLKTEGIDKFNSLYSQANDCLKGIQDNKAVATYNKGLITGYVDQLNSLHQQMQTRAANTKPDPDAIWNVTNEMAKLQAEICGKLTELNNTIKATPGTIGGVRGEVMKPKVESVAITNNSPQVQQKAAYQQAANSYVNAANNTTDSIEKAKYQSLATINALASGNRVQVAQIQQQQNQQVLNNVTKSLQSISDQITADISANGRQTIASMDAKFNISQQLVDRENKLKSEAAVAFATKDYTGAIEKFYTAIFLGTQDKYNENNLEEMPDNAKYGKPNERAITANYFPKVNRDVHAYETLNLPNSLPDLFYLPLCHCYTNPAYNRVYDDAFILLRDIAKCKQIHYNGATYDVGANKKKIASFDEDGAITALHRAIDAKPLNSIYDWMDYTQSYVWLGYLENRKAATVGDLYRGLNTLLTFYRNLPLGTPFIKQLGLGDDTYITSSYGMISYFISNYFYRIAASTKDENLRKIIAYNLYKLINATEYMVVIHDDNDQYSKEYAAIFRDLGYSLLPPQAMPVKTAAGMALSNGKAKFIRLIADHDGTLYASFTDGACNSAVTVKKFDETGWVSLGSAGDFAGYTSLAVNKGVPYIVYQDLTNDFKATVKKYSGGNWITLGKEGFMANTDDHVYSPSIAVNKNGIPYVAYMNNPAYDLGTAVGKSTVMKFDNNNWTTVGSPEFSTNMQDYINIVIDPAGTLYIASDNGIKFTNEKWLQMVANTSPSYDCVISIAPDGIPYMASTDDDKKEGKVSLKKYDGQNWVIVGTPRFSAGKANDLSVAFDKTGVPYVAYQDKANGNRATVMKYDGTSWLPVGRGGFSAGFAEYTSIAIDANGAPCVAFSDGENDGKATVMKFNGTNWIAL